jgi:DNA end-binding protein Ku
MSRAMWSGNISFGMVTIPVRLHTATEGYGIAFHQLHDKCDTRIQEHRWCPHCEENVEWEDIVKGYEYAKGKYVELTKEDFEKLPLPSKHTIDVSDFVKLDEIDPIYFDSIYYIEVEKGSEKAYRLLLQTMSSKGLAGIATIAFRSKERLCALRPMQKTMVLQTLLYDDEIKKNEYAREVGSPSAQEKKMAEMLVATLTTKFNPNKFKDNYDLALKKLINSKLKGTKLKIVEKEEPTEATELMEALKRSLAAGGRKGSSAAGGRKGSSAAKTTKRKKAS